VYNQHTGPGSTDLREGLGQRTNMSRLGFPLTIRALMRERDDLRRWFGLPLVSLRDDPSRLADDMLRATVLYPAIDGALKRSR
jgi:hypothetical protein